MLFVSYKPGEGHPPPAKRGKPVDCREVPSPEDFAVYAKLRTLRKTVADGEGQPIYTLFANEQQAEMVLRRVVSAEALGKIPGVGEARLKKYSQRFLAVLQQEVPALPATPQPGPGGEAARKGPSAGPPASDKPEPEPGGEA